MAGFKLQYGLFGQWMSAKWAPAGGPWCANRHAWRRLEQCGLPVEAGAGSVSRELPRNGWVMESGYGDAGLLEWPVLFENC